MKRTFLALSVVSMFASSAMAANVATTDVNNITATVSAKCQWTSPFALAFGAYDPFATVATTGTTTAKFNCVRASSVGDVYKVWLSKTSGFMIHTNNNDTINYSLAQSDGTVWPTAASSAVTIAGTPGVTSANGYVITVDGSIAAQQDALVGDYSDTVVANINY